MTTPTLGSAAELPALSDEQILHLKDIHVGDPTAGYPIGNSDWIIFARAVIAPAQSQLDALREEVARLTKERDEARAKLQEFALQALTDEQQAEGKAAQPEVDAERAAYFRWAEEQAPDDVGIHSALVGWMARAELAGKGAKP